MARKFNWTGLEEKLSETVSSKKGKGQTVDGRFYKQIFSEDGIAQTVIRFLPTKTDDTPIVTIYKHKFQGPGGYYFNNCPTTIPGSPCPVCEANRAIWETNEDLARSRARKQTFIANILVVTDPLTPSNNGKVFLLEFPKAIYNKIWAKIKPGKGSIEEPCVVFDYETGANFKLIATQKTVMIQGKKIVYPNYDDSSFSNPSRLGTSADIDNIEQQLFDIEEFVKPDQFKSYDELKQRFERISLTNSTKTAISRNKKSVTEEVNEEEDMYDDEEAQLSVVKKTERVDFDTTDDDFIANLKKGAKKK